MSKALLALVLALGVTPAFAQQPVRVVNVPHVICDSGCTATTDTDDGSIATGQTVGLRAGLTQVYDGAVWRRLTFGQAAMTASVPVVIASDQSALTVATHAVTQSGAWSVTATQATGTNLHTVVDSGAITATGSGNFTVVQPTATNLNVNTTRALTSTTGSLTGVGQQLVLTSNGASSAMITITGAWVATVGFTCANTSANVGILVLNTQTGAMTSSASANGTWLASLEGCTALRVNAGSFTSGSVDITLEAVAAPAGLMRIYDQSNGNMPNIRTSSPAGTEAGFVVRNIPSGTQAVSNAGLTNLDIALSALRDAIVGAGPKTLTDVVTQLTAIAASVATTSNVAGTPGNAPPTQVEMGGARDAANTVQAIRASSQGALLVQTTPSLALPLLPCNPVRRYNCAK